MAINYPAMAATALRLLTENGAAGTLRTIVPGAYDPLTDISTDVVTDYTVPIVMIRLNQGVDDYDIQLVYDAYVEGKASKAIIPCDSLPANIMPRVGDRLITGAAAQVWTIKGVTPINPADVPLVHILVVVRE